MLDSDNLVVCKIVAAAAQASAWWLALDGMRNLPLL